MREKKDKEQGFERIGVGEYRPAVIGALSVEMSVVSSYTRRLLLHFLSFSFLNRKTVVEKKVEFFREIVVINIAHTRPKAGLRNDMLGITYSQTVVQSV